MKPDGSLLLSDNPHETASPEKYHTALAIYGIEPKLNAYRGIRRCSALYRRKFIGSAAAGAPRRRPSVLKSSSKSGQCIPYPAPAIFQ